LNLSHKLSLQQTNLKTTQQREDMRTAIPSQSNDILSKLLLIRGNENYELEMHLQQEPEEEDPKPQPSDTGWYFPNSWNIEHRT
jgi:hypothetical protein